MKSPFPQKIHPNLSFACAKLNHSSESTDSKKSERNERDSALGREAARIATMNLAGVELQPGRGLKGEPIWPTHITGSISHKTGVAIAAVGFSSEYKAIGVDLEFESPKAFSALRRIATSSETIWVNERQAALNAMILFSTKESIYKALYPICRLFFGFHSVELTPVSETTMRARLLKSLGSELPEGFEFETYVFCKAGAVVTGVVLKRD